MGKAALKRALSKSSAHDWSVGFQHAAMLAQKRNHGRHRRHGKEIYCGAPSTSRRSNGQAFFPIPCLPCLPWFTVFETPTCRAGSRRSKPEKYKRARQSCDRRARKWVLGVRHALFPMPTLGASSREGCRLPDAILHGKRSCRPRSRAVPRIAATELLSEAFQLASTGGCATGLRTRSRHACNLLRVLTA